MWIQLTRGGEPITVNLDHVISIKTGHDGKAVFTVTGEMYGLKFSDVEEKYEAVYSRIAQSSLAI